MWSETVQQEDIGDIDQVEATDHDARLDVSVKTSRVQPFNFAR